MFKTQDFMNNPDFLTFRMITNLLKEFNKKVLNTNIVQNLLKDTHEKFDAVVVEWMYSELGSG